MMIHQFFVILLALTGVTAAFADLDGNGEEDRQPSQQRRVVTQRQQAPQQRVAQPPAPQYQEDTFEQLRNINGRVDVLENQIGQLNALNSGEKSEVAKTKKELDAKFVAYEEALKKMEIQITALNEEVTKMREEMATKAKPEEPKKSEGKSGAKPKSAALQAFEEAEALLAQKKWREAIISYEDYRKAAPKGKSYADATYKIGVCMQEVGMKAEAKLFFDEVVAKFPGSKEAKKAAFRLKSLK